MLNSRRDLIVAVGASFAGLNAPAIAQERAPTPQQRIGPFYPVVGDNESQADLTLREGGSMRAIGQLVEVTGRVLDPSGMPVGSALVIVWQADAAGHYDHPADATRSQRDRGLAGHAIMRTARDGGFRLITVRPGPYPDERSRSGLRTPHIHFEIIGEEGRLITEMYFPDEPLNVADANIAEMVAAGADPRLLTARAQASAQPGIATSLCWDVVLNRR
jgi:protocatechuate 3,4-dioxygenase, beta subunit